MRRILLLLSVCCISATGTNLADTPISRLQTPWWKQRFEQKQAELRAKSPGLIWLGDSITQDWERDGPQPWLKFKPVWNKYYGSRNAVNLGFKGDSTCHLLWRLLHGELDGYNPKIAILLIGANNFGHIHTDADTTLVGILDVISTIRRKHPTTRIVLVGVLPSIRSTWVDDNTTRLNIKLKTSFENNPFVTFVDASGIFLVDRRVDPSSFIDPKLIPPEPALHPTAQAQEKLAALIEPVLERDRGAATP